MQVVYTLVFDSFDTKAVMSTRLYGGENMDVGEVTDEEVRDSSLDPTCRSHSHCVCACCSFTMTHLLCRRP